MRRPCTSIGPRSIASTSLFFQSRSTGPTIHGVSHWSSTLSPDFPLGPSIMCMHLWWVKAVGLVSLQNQLLETYRVPKKFQACFSRPPGAHEISSPRPRTTLQGPPSSKHTTAKNHFHPRRARIIGQGKESIACAYMVLFFADETTVIRNAR